MAEKTITTPLEEQGAQQEVTRSPEQYLRPAVDILESEEGLTLITDLPGVDREQLNVTIENGVLTLEAVVAPSSRGRDVYREFDLTGFYRQFQLSEEIDQDKARADLNNGVLTLRLFKSEAAKPRKIAIQAA